MRGRINSDLYSGIAINATTDQFEVSGGNIMAGDFVQYKYASAERKYLNNSSDNLQFYNIVDDFYISGTGVLYKIVSDDLIEKDSISYQAICVDKIDDNYFVCLAKESTLVGKLIFVEVDVVNDVFNILATYDFNLSSSGLIGIANMPNDKLIVIGSSETFVFSIQDLSNIQLLNTLSISISGKYVGHNDTALICLKFGTYQSGSNSQTRIQQLDFDDTTNTLTLYDGPRIYSNSSTSGLQIGQFNINSGAYGGRFQIILLISTFSSGRDFGMYIWDMQSKTGKRVSITAEMVYDATYQSKCELSEIINEEFYLSSVSNKLGISKCKITTSGELQVVGSLCLLDIAYLVKHPINMNNKFILVTSNSGANYNETYYYNGSNISGELVIGEQQDVVEPYNGANPRMLMGVAATSGQIGNTIDVYMPVAIT